MGRLDAARFKKFHQDSGEQIRWFKAIPVPYGTTGRMADGVLLREQTIDTAARFLVSSTSDDFESAEFGLIQKGTMQISAFPDWARFNHLDRVILLAPGRALSQVEEVTRGDTATDSLRYTPLHAITAVWIAGVEVDAASYEATTTGITWLSSAPTADTLYAVEYTYAPRYLVLPQNHRTSPTDQRGNPLPLSYWLQWEKRDGNDEIV